MVSEKKYFFPGKSETAQKNTSALFRFVLLRGEDKMKLVACFDREYYRDNITEARQKVFLIYETL